MGEGLHEVTGASESHCGATFSLSCVNTHLQRVIQHLYTDSILRPKDQSTTPKIKAPPPKIKAPLVSQHFRCRSCGLNASWTWDR